MFTIEVPGLPRECQHCGHEIGPDYWLPLAVHAAQLIVQCPHCFSRIGPVMAVRPAGERDA